jgi:hypothetical protein
MARCVMALLELARIAAWAQAEAHAGTAGIVKGLHMLARHTGVPVLFVAAAALVVSWRLARRAARLTIEFAVALVVVTAATKFGWIHW